MTKNNNNQLAIVMPAYKARFLRQALESIARQTDKRFTAYVGDDASPDNIREICDDFTDRFDLVYTRFDENLGQKSLVAHWNRCIEVSSEPWIWLFCDDDVMEPRCVEMFYRTIEREKDNFRVLRFNTLTIDDDGNVTRTNPTHPLTESGIQFIYHRLQGERSSFVTEYIFSREAYIENKGMIDFPIAWASDDASWLVFSGDQGILTIQGALVLWRHGAYNISPPGPKYQTMRIEAAFRFVTWLDNYIKMNEKDDQQVTGNTIKQLSKNWFLNQIQCVTPITLSNYANFARFIHCITEKGWTSSYIFLLGANCRFLLSRFKNKLIH
jgi:glycosyltransferase involved in cell wall biosynthesis